MFFYYFFYNDKSNAASFNIPCVGHAAEKKKYIIKVFLSNEAHYPLLNKEYWKHITIPKPGEGVKVMSTSLEPAIVQQLQQIEFAYYHPWNGQVTT